MINTVQHCSGAEQLTKRGNYQMAKLFYAMNNTWYDIDTKESHEEGMVKDDWVCQLCMYNSGKNKNIKMFKGIGNGRFKIFCNQCNNMGDMVDFLLGEGTEARVRKFLDNMSEGRWDISSGSVNSFDESSSYSSSSSSDSSLDSESEEECGGDALEQFRVQEVIRISKTL